MPYGDYRDFSPGGEYYDPVAFRQDEITRGRETGTFATHGGSLEEIQAALDELSSDPAIMQALRQGHTSGVESRLAERYGLALPRHYALDVDEGRIVPRQQGKWERWKTPVLLSAAMFGGGFAAEALMGAGAGAGAGAAGVGGGTGAGAGAATAGGVGIGETGAVTGLAGSGFGGAASAGSGLGSRLITAGATAGLQGLGQKFGPKPPLVPPEVQELLRLQRQQVEMQNQRMQQQNPLFASIIQMAMSRLPTSMQQPTSPAASPAQQDVVSAFARRRTP